jgi:uncharacterized protein (TIGR02001 family)
MKNGLLLTTTLLGSLFVSTQALAGASANIGATSNYMWRGVTQTQDGGAAQAGLDYAADNGLYVGTWTSNVRFPVGGTKQAGTELDVYGGYKKELESGLSYDVGVISYNYAPDAIAQNFAEVYGKVGYKGVGAEVDYTVSKEDHGTTPYHDVYYALGYNGSLPNDWSYGVKAGKYNFKDPAADDYNHTQLSLTKTVGKAGDFTLAVDKPSGLLTTADAKANSAKVSLSWKKSFDF